MTNNDNNETPSSAALGTNKIDLAFRPDPIRTTLISAQKLHRSGKLEQAVESCRKALNLNPTHADANRLMGILQQALKQPELAVEYYEKSLAAQPNHPASRFNLAHALHLLRRNEESVEQFKLGLQVLETKNLQLARAELAEVYFQMAFAYHDLLLDDEEEQSLRKAVDACKTHVGALHGLGRVLGRMGHADEAIELLRTALRLEPGMVAAHRDLAMAKQHASHDEELKATEQLYVSGRLSAQDEAHLAFAIGKAHEELGQFEPAFEYWANGNRLTRQLNPYDVESDVSILKSIREIFTPAYIKAEGSQIGGNITPIFIVSMPRAGSSLVEQILASHSMLSAGGEITTLTDILKANVDIFPEDLGLLTHLDWEQLGADYLEQTSELLHGNAYFSDKFLSNYRYLGAIHMMLPNAKIIHCVRNPMDTALSCYKNVFGAAGLPFSYDLQDLGVMYRHYEAQMSHWHSTFPDWIYDIEYERLTANPEDEIRKLLEYVGLPFEDNCLRYYETKRSTRTISETQVRKPIYQSSVKKWQNFESQLEPFQLARSTAS